MADELPDPNERYQELLVQVLAAYALVMVYLERLPLPIALPEMDERWTAVIGLPAVDRARRVLIPEQPIDSFVMSLYQRILGDWLTAYEMGALIRVAGPAPWRFDILETALVRVVAATELLDEHSSGEEPQE